MKLSLLLHCLQHSLHKFDMLILIIVGGVHGVQLVHGIFTVSYLSMFTPSVLENLMHAQWLVRSSVTIKQRVAALKNLWN